MVYKMQSYKNPLHFDKIVYPIHDYMYYVYIFSKLEPWYYLLIK